jgi:hypothetical protein
LLLIVLRCASKSQLEQFEWDRIPGDCVGRVVEIHILGPLWQSVTEMWVAVDAAEPENKKAFNRQGA